MSDGKEYASDGPERLRSTYNVAKLHLQVCLSYFAPGLSHNHVHFVLPSVIAVLSQKLLKRNGILYKLLYQHFRFTERINFQALRIQKATNNKRSRLDRLFFLWQPFPLTKEQFLEGVAKKCKKHYIDKGKATFDEKSNNAFTDQRKCIPELSPNDSASSLQEIEPRKHSIFPPDFVTDERLQKIPYLNFLAQYYFVIREFIKSLIPYIDGEEWEKLCSEVTKHVPNFERCNMIDAITTFIHQVGVIHYCDHETYLRYFSFRYGCMSIRTPFAPFEDYKEWNELASDNKLNLKKVKANPTSLIRQTDVLRTRLFLKVFAEYIPSDTLNLRLVDTQYGFDEQGPRMAVQRFHRALRHLDGRLSLQASSFQIPENDGERRADGMRLIPADEIIRTVCF